LRSIQQGGEKGGKNPRSCHPSNYGTKKRKGKGQQEQGPPSLFRCSCALSERREKKGEKQPLFSREEKGEEGRSRGRFLAESNALEEEEKRKRDEEGSGGFF